MSKSKVYIELQAKDDVTPVTRKMDKNTEQAFNKMKAHAKASTASMGSSLQKLKQHWVAYSVGAVAAVVAVRAVVKKMMSILQTWTQLSMAQEDAEIGLAASLKANLQYTDQLNQKYQEFAATIQKKTRYGDEEVLQLMALQKNLGVASDKIEEATKMSIGLAAATGRDVQSMAMYVALAQQGEFTMLRRYIPALRSATDATEQMRIVTDFAARGFKVAQEMTESFSGSLKQTGNLYADLKEKITNVITKNETILFLMKEMKRWLIEAGEKVDAWREKNQALIDQKMEEYLTTTLNLLAGIAEAVKLVYKGYEKLTKLFKDNGAVLNIPLIGQIVLIKKALEKWGEYKRSLKEAGAEHEIITQKIDDTRAAMDKLNQVKKSWGEPLEEAYWIDSHEFAEKFAYDLGLINYELNIFQLQSEAAWAAYQKGIQEAIPKQDEFMAGIYGERAAIMLLEQEIEEGLAQSFKSIDDQGVTTFDNLKNAVTGWASTFSAQLTDMLWAADTTFKNILKSFGRMVMQMMIQKAVIEPMLGVIFPKAPVASAHGNVFNNGTVIPFARGGIVDKPTVFPMATGMGLMGEKGPEAVMPLARTKTGDLGVKTQGASLNIEFNMINQSGQPLQATQQGSRYASGKHIIDVVVKDLQRGGSLRQVIRSTV